MPPGAAASGSDNLKPKKPMNSFLLFCRHFRPLVKDKYPSLENQKVTKILGEWWNNWWLYWTEEVVTDKDLTSRHQAFLLMKEMQQLKGDVTNDITSSSPVVTNPQASRSTNMSGASSLEER